MILIFFLLPQLFFCQTIKELKKYSSLEVIPDEKIYLDISTFNDNEEVYFEITMNLFLESGQEKEEYAFCLEQVPFATLSDPSYWDNLPQVIANYKEKKSDDITFKYDVTKQPGSTYIYIKLSEPFEGYYNINPDFKIKIKNVKGINALPIALAIVLPIITIFIIVIIILCCVFKRMKRNKANRIKSVNSQSVCIQQNPQQQNYPQQSYIYQNVPQQSYFQPNIPQNNNQYLNAQQNYPQQNYAQQNYPQQNYPQQNYQQPNIPDTAYNSHSIQQPYVPDSNYTSNPQISAYQHPLDAQIDSKAEIIGNNFAAPGLYNQ